jgi:hypothetical protein
MSVYRKFLKKFPKIKDKMNGITFSLDEVVKHYENLVSEVSPEEWHHCLKDWFHRMQKCIDVKGDIWKYNKIIKIFCVALVLGLKHHLKKDQLLEAVKLEHAKATAIMKNIIGKCQLNDIVENLQNLYLHICYVILQNLDW